MPLLAKMANCSTRRSGDEMADDDLLRLRQGLLDGTISDEHLENALVGDNNVLLYQEKRR